MDFMQSIGMYLHSSITDSDNFIPAVIISTTVAIWKTIKVKITLFRQTASIHLSSYHSEPWSEKENFTYISKRLLYVYIVFLKYWIITESNVLIKSHELIKLVSRRKFTLIQRKKCFPSFTLNLKMQLWKNLQRRFYSLQR